MKTLEEHNKHAMERFNGLHQQYINGIACPKCGEELLDSNPGMILISYPPKKNVHCQKCNYIGYRIS